MRISDWSSDVCSSDLGMDKVVKTAKTMGLGEYPSVLAISLGAGETTVLKLVNAYSMMVNGGKQLAPTLIDLVQNRHGKIIYRRDTRPCEGCTASDWNGKARSRPPARSANAMDPTTAETGRAS